MRLKVIQPPIAPFARPSETRSWWPGLTAASIGLLLTFYGALRVTDIETVQGNMASELEVNMAMAHGGIKDNAKTPPPNLAESDSTLNPPAYTPPLSGRSRLRIDTSIKAACPT